MVHSNKGMQVIQQSIERYLLLGRVLLSIFIPIIAPPRVVMVSLHV